MKTNNGPSGRNKLALQTRFALNLKAAMGEMTCTLVTARVGISAKRVSAFRQAETIPSFAEFVALAKAIGCPATALLEGLEGLV